MSVVAEFLTPKVCEQHETVNIIATFVIETGAFKAKFSVRGVDNTSPEAWKRFIDEDDFSMGFAISEEGVDLSIERRGDRVIFTGYQILGLTEIEVPFLACRGAFEAVMERAKRTP